MWHIYAIVFLFSYKEEWNHNICREPTNTMCFSHLQNLDYMHIYVGRGHASYETTNETMRKEDMFLMEDRGHEKIESIVENTWHESSRANRWSKDQKQRGGQMKQNQKDDE